MKVILFFLEKEFKQIFRNKTMVPIIFAMPVIQLLVLSYAVDYEIKNMKLFVIDKDQSEFSRQLTHKFTASGYFQIIGNSFKTQDGKEALENNTADLTLEIPPHFDRDLFKEGQGKVQLLINAIDGAKAGLASNYANTILMEFNKMILVKYGIRTGLTPSIDYRQIDVENSFWFNPDLNYKAYMVPGILVLLVTMVSVFLSSMNIVREKELGTIEQINVTPVKKYQFIIGKTLPFWLLALFELTVGLIVAKLVFNIPMVGHLIDLYLFASVYIIAVLGMGLFISTITDTQQQAMFISWFFLVIFILMGGLFTAIENMPNWAQDIAFFNPIRYFIEVTRMVLLKGSGLYDLRYHFLVIAVFALAINTLAIYKYRKTV